MQSAAGAQRWGAKDRFVRHHSLTNQGPRARWVLRQAVLKRPEQFVRTMTENAFDVRPRPWIEYYDMPVVRSILRDSPALTIKFSSLVLGIVKSGPFQMR